MDFLFIHGNYPAQFRHLVAMLGQNPAHRVVFLTARQDASKAALPGVEVHTYACHRTPSNLTHHYLQASEEAVLQGQAVLREVAALVEGGLQPRVVVSHGGMGMGLFLKDLLPQSLHVGYFEWYFQPETTQHLLPQFDLDAQLKIGLRNLPILRELERCDLAVVPTDWQKSQFPQAYQAKLKVIFDGIDTSFFHHAPEGLDLAAKDLALTNRDSGESVVLRAGRRVLSYATRGMEPLRGFPEFLRALPHLLEDFPDLDVVIAGADRRAYSYDAPSHGGSWKEHELAKLGRFKGRNRVHFTGLLNYHDYRQLLWRSNLHCYFTRPYVTSWSLFEAASCGARLAVSKGQATNGIVEADTVYWVDLDDQEALTRGMRQGLIQPAIYSQILPGYELSRSLQQWGDLLNRALQGISQTDGQ
jgi:glycosyltransferase involved in cell wall biosynthesis